MSTIISFHDCLKKNTDKGLSFVTHIYNYEKINAFFFHKLTTKIRFIFISYTTQHNIIMIVNNIILCQLFLFLHVYPQYRYSSFNQLE